MIVILTLLGISSSVRDIERLLRESPPSRGRGGCQRFSRPAMAARTVLRRTASRSPAKRLRSAVTWILDPRLTAQANHTVPTGLPGTAPSGPAIPVTATATCAPERRRAPRAIARATASLTAPWAFNTDIGTPRRRTFDSLL